MGLGFRAQGSGSTAGSSVNTDLRSLGDELFLPNPRGPDRNILGSCPEVRVSGLGFRVPVLESLCKSIRSIAQGPTIWVPGLLGQKKVS